MPKSCYLISSDIPCFVHLGKYGDQMILMPALREIFRRTGIKPVVIVSRPYDSIYEGVSYADCIPVVFPDHRDGIGPARQMAWYLFGNAIVPKWWDDPEALYPEVVDSQHRLVMSYRGKPIQVDTRMRHSYMLDQWRATGFPDADMTRLPLVFDRRSWKREAALLEGLGRIKKPILLTCFEGQSSPFSFVPEVVNSLEDVRDQFHVVALDGFRAHRIYDLLGLFDRAAGMITIDTATLHLAAASRIPHIAITRHDWGHSTTRGNCILEVRYPETLKRLSEIKTAVRSLLKYVNPRLDPIRSQRSRHEVEKLRSSPELEIPIVA